VSERTRRVRQPCIRCGALVDLSRAAWLFSFRHDRNVGPFHARCSDLLTIAEEDAIWARVAAGEQILSEIPHYPEEEVTEP